MERHIDQIRRKLGLEKATTTNLCVIRFTINDNEKITDELLKKLEEEEKELNKALSTQANKVVVKFQICENIEFTEIKPKEIENEPEQQC